MLWASPYHIFRRADARFFVLQQACKMVYATALRLVANDNRTCGAGAFEVMQ